MTRLADLFRGRMARLVAMLIGAYLVAAAFIDSPVLLLIFNELVMSAAIGVCFGYAPVLPVALTNPRPSEGEYLGAGIFFVSAGMLVLRFVSTAARDLGYPEIYNSHAVPLALACCFLGALMHLRALNAPRGAPVKHWTKPGVAVAIGVFFALAAWTVHAGLQPTTVVQLR